MSHYYDESPASASARATVHVRLPDTSYTMATDRGVFSHGRLDRGTELLLRAAPAPPTTGDVLDLGCGAGALALALARRAPTARVWAVDVNERARALCAANARDNAAGNIIVAAPDDVPSELRFAAIWSNPPIRVGKAALHDLLAGWLDRLAPGGRAVLVVQRHLGADSLQRWLVAEGWPTTRLASARGYRLLESRPRGTPAP